MINSNDIYDVAAALRHEFERLMTMYGPECVSQLIPKTVYVLELLEQLTDAGQKKNVELEELHNSVEKMKVDREVHLIERDKYKKDLEVLEESWKKELFELSSYTKQLQEENQRLCSIMHDQNRMESTVLDEAQSSTLLMEQVITLRDTMLRQCDELRGLRHEVDEKNSEVEAMQSQIERLLKLNADCWQRNNLTKQHVESLLQEVVDLQLSLKEKEQLIEKLQKQLAAMISNPDEVSGPSPKPCDGGVKDATMSYDDESEQPRFTLAELRGVLNERNKLKMKLYEMEEELEKLSPSSSSLTNFGADICAMRDDTDLPVQGPINKEPDEKLYPNRNERSPLIRRLFKHFLEQPAKDGE